jgi:hypothetical protein
MPNNNALLILERFEQRGPVRQEGRGWKTRCPHPDHEDRDPSFFLYPGGGGKCFSQCAQYWPPRELASLLGISLPHWDGGLTLSELAEAKGIPENFLGSLGVANGYAGTGKQRRECVDIPYSNEKGEIVAVRKRLRLEGQGRYLWRRGDHPTLYGLPYLADIKRTGKVVLVEGETDCWTLWHHGIPSLGIPGASMWQSKYAVLLEGLNVYLWCEPDGGGDGLLKSVSADLPNLRLITEPEGAKDPSELYLQVGDGFKQTMENLLTAARPFKEFQVEAFTEEARQSLATAQDLLDSPELISKLSESIEVSGYAGDTRPAIMAYVAISSRLLRSPLNLAYISQSSAGKNAAVDAALPFVPETNYYLVRASSPRALIYNDEEFTNRIVILTEADSLPEDGPAASAMRSLMSDGEMSYEVTEKGEDGQHHTRKIVKKGPTGLITTSTKPLGDQASTRTLTVTISDSVEQTRAIMHVHASRADQGLPELDFSAWLALQRWLELAGEKRVVVPFGHSLADLVTATSVRMRRDFNQLLIVIQTIAMLHQRLRNKDGQGRIIATIADYREARSLLDEVFTTTVSEGATPAIRETVEAVRYLSPTGNTVMQIQLMSELKLGKSVVHYRVGRALKGGWLVNQTTIKGAPAQLVLGEPLPDGNPLPHPDELVCVENPESDSNLRTVPEIDQGSNEGSNEDFNPIAPNSGVEPPGFNRGFERFEPIPVSTTHTTALVKISEGPLPWDPFLDEEKDNEPNVN